MSRLLLVVGVVILAGYLLGFADEASPFGFVPATGSLLPCYVAEQLHPVPLEGAQIYLGPGSPYQPVRDIQIPRANQYWECHGWGIPEACAHFYDMDAASISEWVQTHYREELIVNGQELTPSYVSIAPVMVPEQDNTVHWAIRYAYQFPDGSIAPGIYILSLEHTWTMTQLICTPSEWVPELIEITATGPQTTTVTILYEPE